MSGPGSAAPQRAWRAGALWVGLWALTAFSSPVRADAGWKLVLVQPENSELTTRVEGQTRDLGVQVQVASARGAGLTAEQGAAIAAAEGANFVARVQRTSKAVLEVRVYAAGQRSLRTRELPSRARGDRLGTSAQLEAAALVLRGELTALIAAEREAEAAGAAATPAAMSGSTGSGSATSTAAADTAATQQRPVAANTKPRTYAEASAPESERELLSEPEPEDSDEEVEEAPSPPLENYSSRPPPWTLRGGISASLAVNSNPAGAALLGARVQVAFLEFGAALSTALPIELADRNVQISVRRSTLTGEALAAFPAGPRLRALLGLEAGVVMDARATERVARGFRAEGSGTAWSATLGVQAELQWLFTPQLGAALGAGLAYLPQRTRFAYTGSSSQALEIAELRSLEPRAVLSFFGRFGD